MVRENRIGLHWKYINAVVLPETNAAHVSIRNGRASNKNSQEITKAKVVDADTVSNTGLTRAWQPLGGLSEKEPLSQLLRWLFKRAALASSIIFPLDRSAAYLQLLAPLLRTNGSK